MATLDDAVTRSIWHGKLPIKITWAEQDEPQAMEPVFMQVARSSYLPLVTDEFLRLVSGLISTSSPIAAQDVWYDCQDRPLRWHYPIGLLYDLMQAESSDATSLPWQIRVHTSGFPKDQLLLQPGTTAVKDMFMSMIKQADVLLHGSTKKVMNLSKHNQTQLWDTLCQDHYDTYHEVCKQLHSDDTLLRHLPIRIYLTWTCPVIQELVPLRDDQGQARTIGDALTLLFPDLFTDTPSAIRVICHGITLPLNTPLHWAYEHLVYADRFLHLVLTKSA